MKKLLKKHFALALAAVFALTALTACSGTTDTAVTTAGSRSATEELTETAVQSKLKVITTIYPLQFLAEKIGGDKVEVTNLMPGGMDPHDWEPSAGDMTKLAEADAVIYNGAGLEAWLEAAKKTLGESSVNFIDASENIELLKGGHHHHHHEDGAEHDHDHDHDGEEAHDHEHADEHGHDAAATHEHDHDHDGEEAHDHEHADEHGHDATATHDHDHDHDGEEAHDHEHADEHGHDAENAHEHEHEHEESSFDPHVWTNPMLFSKMAENVTQALVKMNAADKDYFEQNLSALQEELQKLHNEYAEKLENVKNKTFLVSHGAFQYIAKQYGLTQATVTEGEHHDPSPSAMQDLIEKAKKEGIKAVYYDIMDNAKVAETIAEAIGGTAYPISTLENRAESQKDKDYLDIMRDNLQVLVEGLNK